MFLNTVYIQKSKLLLYPLLNIPKDMLQPVTSYGFSLKKKINPEDCKLICKYKREHDEKYFEKRSELFNHEYFEDIFRDSEYDYLIFDLNHYKKDITLFYKGLYSELSLGIKREIYEYYSSTKVGPMFIDMHLNPERYHEMFACHFADEEKSQDKLLESIREAHETLDPPNIQKENLFG
jgi:hypothetical protein